MRLSNPLLLRCAANHLAEVPRFYGQKPKLLNLQAQAGAKPLWHACVWRQGPAKCS